MHKRTAKILAGLIATSLVTQIAACGYFMYPERRGHQKGGEIDVKVAVLDGLGLLFGIIPGVIAYIVDFTNGTIYLPSGKKNVVLYERPDVTIIHVDPALLSNPETVIAIVTKEMKLPSVIDWSKLETSAIEPSQIMVRLAEAQAVGYAR